MLHRRSYVGRHEKRQASKETKDPDETRRKGGGKMVLSLTHGKEIEKGCRGLKEGLYVWTGVRKRVKGLKMCHLARRRQALREGSWASRGWAADGGPGFCRPCSPLCKRPPFWPNSWLSLTAATSFFFSQGRVPLRYSGKCGWLSV